MVYHFFAERRYTDLIPVDFGYQDKKPDEKFGPYIREHYLIHYVKSGKGYFKTEKKTYEVNAGEVFIIKPGEVTTYGADHNDPWSYMWIGFSGTAATVFDKFEVPVVKLESRIFYEMCTVFDIENTKSEFILSKLYMLISEMCEKFAPPAVNDYVMQAKAFVDVNFYKPMLVQDIADYLKINRSYLCRLFTKETNISLKQYIIQVKMKKAAAYLSDKFNVAEAAIMVGYNDTFTFSKRFKAYYNVSPSEYKLKNKSSRLR